jgi:hypothetical protein
MEIVKLAASSIFRTIGSTKKVLWDEVSALNTQWWRLGAAGGSDRNRVIRMDNGRRHEEYQKRKLVQQIHLSFLFWILSLNPFLYKNQKKSYLKSAIRF